MAIKRKGYIMPIKKAARGGGHEGSSNVEFFNFLGRSNETPIEGGEPAKYLKLSVNKVLPGGEVEEHYHEPPVVDHVYYVISGRILASVGELKQVVGSDTLIYCPSNVKHSITNVGKTIATVISIDASPEGIKSGPLVYSKMPSGDLSGKNWKVAGVR